MHATLSGHRRMPGRFDYFYSPLMTDSEFDSKPQVLLIGQYSTGKTTVCCRGDNLAVPDPPLPIPKIQAGSIIWTSAVTDPVAGFHSSSAISWARTSRGSASAQSRPLTGSLRWYTARTSIPCRAMLCASIRISHSEALRRSSPGALTPRRLHSGILVPFLG